jgi:HPt (histidine-containing phosphotransfer) domain-containing protein
MSFSDLMDELRKEYVLELPAKIDSIATHLAGHNHGVVREDFHKLKGTGKTYGIPEISELAEVVERICVENPEAISTAVPQALTLLRDIHRYRTAAEVFDISDDQRFSMLKRMAS